MTLTVSELRELLHVPNRSYQDWANLRRKTLDAAVAEVNQLAHFNVVVPDDRIRRSGRKVIGLELRFFLKPDTEAAKAAKERDRHSTGRRARREGTVEDVVESMALTGPEDLALLWRKVHGMVERDPLLKDKPVKATLADLELVAVEDGTARLTAISGSVADRVRQHYDDVLRRAFGAASGGAVRDVEVSAVRGSAR
jgi:plasmid replication initiation protein